MKTVLLAFDGLSKEDVDEEFVLEPVKELGEQYTSIDLTQRPYYFTSELFTDLITGYDRQHHGVKGLEKYTEGRLGLNPTGFEKWLQETFQPLFFYGNSFRQGLFQAFLDSYKVKWERSDIQMPTLFEQYGNVEQGQIPVWDWRKADVFHHLKGEDNQVVKSRQHIVDEWHRSRRKFWGNVEDIDWEEHDDYVYMHHFHYIDWMQHLYREDDNFNDMMREHWFNVSEFVEEVEAQLPENVELVVMSDHGLPERFIGHRPNPFLSASSKLFPDNPTLWDMNYVLRMMAEGKHAKVGLEEGETGTESEGDEGFVSRDEFEDSEGTGSDVDEEKVKERLEDLGYM